jgi:hypothetical protein
MTALVKGDNIFQAPNFMRNITDCYLHNTFFIAVCRQRAQQSVALHKLHFFFLQLNDPGMLLVHIQAAGIGCLARWGERRLCLLFS